MFYNVNDHAQHLNYFCHVSDVFSEEEVENILDLGEMQEFQKGLVADKDKFRGSAYNKNTRESDVAWLRYFEQSAWLFDKFSILTSHVNHDNFLYKLSGFESFQYTVYKEDSHYDWHMDIESTSNRYVRKISASIMLSDPNSYEGGELNFILGGQVNSPYIIKPNKGDVVFFTSWTPHKVSPVTSGIRKSLVCWVLGERS